jgi:hypothetical protein
MKLTIEIDENDVIEAVDALNRVEVALNREFIRSALGRLALAIKEAYEKARQ